MKKKIAIFISGRGSNMQAIHRQIENGVLKELCEITLVFSNKAAAGGLSYAKENGLNTAYIESKGKKREAFDQSVVELLHPYHIDYIVLAGFMRILSPVLISAYKNKIINIHPADTNEFKGIGAYEWAFKNKKKSTKITVHFVDEGVDTGKVIWKQEVDLKGALTLEEIEKRGLKAEHELYSKALARLFTNRG
jgi:phosphoribosylglycinamide formyltransferase-1